MINLTVKDNCLTKDSEALLKAYFATVFPDVAAKQSDSTITWTLADDSVTGTCNCPQPITLHVSLGQDMEVLDMSMAGDGVEDTDPVTATPMQELEIRSSVVKEQPQKITEAQILNFWDHLIYSDTDESDCMDDDIDGEDPTIQYPDIPSAIKNLDQFAAYMRKLSFTFEKTIRQLFAKYDQDKLYIECGDIEYLTLSKDGVTAHFSSDHFDTFFVDLSPVDQVNIFNQILETEAFGV